MSNALYIGATGMQAQQLNVDIIANNLVNVNTAGFKKGRVRFTELMTREAVLQGAGAEEAGPLATTPRLGSGVGVARVSRSFEPGSLQKTGSALDVAIVGDGFLEVTLPDGTRGFTRGGTLKVNAEGQLATRSGHPLKAWINVPANATGLQIGADGRVQITVPGHSAPIDAGQLELVRFTDPGALRAEGGDVLRATEAAGESVAARPGEDGCGQLAQGSVEASNVNLTDELVELMVAQRAYEASVKVVQASDELMGMVNGLRR